MESVTKVLSIVTQSIYDTKHLAGSVREIQLFRGLPSDQVDRIVQIAVRKNFERGDLLFIEGRPAEGFFVVLRGFVKVYKLSRDGKEQILHLFRGGEVVGEVPVFAGGCYPAHAEAMERTETLYVLRDRFMRLISDEPTLAMNMLAILARRLRQFTILIENLSLKEVPSRFAAYLLYEREKRGGDDTVDLDVAKGQLASFLGTVPETFSRILSKMVRRGIIEVTGRRIFIRDPELLARVAQGEKFL